MLLARQGIFRTVQGEGCLLGEPMIFIRLGGCSIGCPECDTDYRTVEKISVSEVVKRVENISLHSRDWVWLTGGEPTDQDLEPLVIELKRLGHPVAIATAGGRPLKIGLFDWISVSPHSINLVQYHGHEIKIVPGLNGIELDDIPKMRIGMFAYKYIQPMWSSAYQPCIDFVLKNPGWRLSIQAHKYWDVL